MGDCVLAHICLARQVERWWRSTWETRASWQAAAADGRLTSFLVTTTTGSRQPNGAPRNGKSTAASQIVRSSPTFVPCHGQATDWKLALLTFEAKGPAIAKTTRISFCSRRVDDADSVYEHVECKSQESRRRRRRTPSSQCFPETRDCACRTGGYSFKLSNWLRMQRPECKPCCCEQRRKPPKDPSCAYQNRDQEISSQPCRRPVLRFSELQRPL
ncbi:hypothetical protein BDZ88DRAFT_270831 [Geranomyces variabilis]|nr:hypothetical protein BDZ88DRAFT_270831 [Geranomyces variabilis]